MPASPAPTLNSAAPLLQARAPHAWRLLRRAQLRLWWQRFSVRMAQWVWLPVTAAALTLVLTRWAILPYYLDRPADLAIAAFALVVLLFAVWHREALHQTAVRLDTAAASHDSLATAVYLASMQRQDGWAETQAAFAERLAQRLQIPSLLPWPRLAGWASAAASLALLAAAVWAPSVPVEQWQRPQLADGIWPRLPGAPEEFASAKQAMGEDQAQLLTADGRLLREIEQQLADPATRRWIHDLREVVQAVQEGRIDKRQALEQLAALEAAKPHQPELDAALESAQKDRDGAKNPEAAPGQAAQRDAQEAERQRDVAARNAVLEATKRAMAEAPEGEDKTALEKALEQGDLGLVAKALEKLAEKDLDAKTIEKWRKTLEKFADALRDAKVPKKLEELAKKIERLEKQRSEQGGLNPSDQRRLQEARREAEQLKRDHGDAQAAQRQVQRLERQARQAADEMRRAQDQGSRLGKEGQQGGKGQKGQQGQQGQQNGGKGQQAMKEAMRQAADELRRQDEGQKSRQAQRIGESRMRDLREALSRERQGGQDRRGQQGQPQGDQQGGEGQGRQAEGKSRLQQGKAGDKSQGQDQHNSGDQAGQPGPEGGQQGQGDEGKGEQSGAAGKRREFKLGSKGLADKSRTELINEGYERRSSQRGQGGQGQKQGDGGSQAGTTPGDKEGQGKKIGMQAARTEKLKGQQGSGPDVKQTFLDAARKGFSRQGWKEVYAEYSQVAEDMLDKEGLPAGRKALVRRYFEKIRPR